MSRDIQDKQHFNLPSPSLLICKMGKIIAPPKGCCGDGSAETSPVPHVPGDGGPFVPPTATSSPFACSDPDPASFCGLHGTACLLQVFSCSVTAHLWCPTCSLLGLRLEVAFAESPWPPPARRMGLRVRGAFSSLGG